MPALAHPLTSNALDRRINHQEPVGAWRCTIDAELGAIQRYMQPIKSANHEKACAVLTDIARQESAPVGEFYTQLKQLEPDEENYYREGEEEVRQRFSKMKGQETSTIGHWLRQRPIKCGSRLSCSSSRW